MNKIKYIISLFILLLLIMPTIVAIEDKADSTIIVNTNNIALGDSEEIIVQVNKDATGVINITVGGNSYSETINNGIATFKIDNLATGSYDVLASYDGDENYLPSTNTSSFNVEKQSSPISIAAKETKASSTLIVNTKDITLGDSEEIIVQINEDATGVINITVDGKTYSEPINNGISTFKIDNLATGSYDVLASYDGDENYLPSTNTSSFNVEKHNSLFLFLQRI